MVSLALHGYRKVSNSFGSTEETCPWRPNSTCIQFMTNSSTKIKVQKRQAVFAEKTVTRIWAEDACPENPYLAQNAHCHGYDLLELARKRSFVDVLLLLFTGELPEPEQARLFETLMILLINPGPRHGATRAAMSAALSRANPAHLLPISLSVLGGGHLGGQEVNESMRFLLRARGEDPALAACRLLTETGTNQSRLAPGFGCRFGGIDPLPQRIAAMLMELPGSGATIRWGQSLAAALNPQGFGWLATGVAAAVFCDLDLPPRAGAGLFQLLSAPGLLAHGLEMADKPITAMPFLDEEHYVIQEEARTKKS